MGAPSRSILTEANQKNFQKSLRLFFGKKNKRNGQSITLVADDDHPDICPVRAAYMIYLRARRLGQSELEPMGIFVNKHGIKRYLTGNNIADVL